MNSLQFSVYKGTGGKFGAVQMNLQRPHYYKEKTKDFTGSQALDENGKLREGWKVREGCIFLEIANTKDKNVYDWETKTVMALSVTDMGKVLHALVTGEECKILHDPGAGTDSKGAIRKNLNISSPNGTSAGALVNVANTAGGETKKYMVPLDGAEVLVLRQLLQAAITNSLAW